MRLCRPCEIIFVLTGCLRILEQQLTCKISPHGSNCLLFGINATLGHYLEAYGTPRWACLQGNRMKDLLRLHFRTNVGFCPNSEPRQMLTTKAMKEHKGKPQTLTTEDTETHRGRHNHFSTVWRGWSWNFWGKGANVIEYGSTFVTKKLFGNKKSNLTTSKAGARSKIFRLLGVRKFSCDCPGHAFEPRH